MADKDDKDQPKAAKGDKALRPEKGDKGKQAGNKKAA